MADDELLREPEKRLPETAKTYWRVAVGLRAGVAVVISTALVEVADDIGVGRLTPVAVALVLGIAATVVIPSLRWRRWRYEIGENEIDLRTGLLTIRRTLVPIRRIQHVDTESGPLQNVFGLASVSFHTAAGATEIPALRRDEAEAVRVRVGELARTRDDV